MMDELGPTDAAGLLDRADTVRSRIDRQIDRRAAGRYWLAFGVSGYVFIAGFGVWAISPGAARAGTSVLVGSLLPLFTLFGFLRRGLRDRFDARPREYPWQSLLATVSTTGPLLLLLIWSPTLAREMRLWLWLSLPLLGLGVGVWFALVQFRRVGAPVRAVQPTPIRAEAWLTAGLGCYFGVATASSGLAAMPRVGIWAVAAGMGVLALAYLIVVAPQRGAVIAQLAEWWSPREWAALAASAAVFLIVVVLAGWSSLPLVPVAIAGGLLSSVPLAIRGLATLRRAE